MPDYRGRPPYEPPVRPTPLSVLRSIPPRVAVAIAGLAVTGAASALMAAVAGGYAW